MIHVESLTKRFGAHEAVRDLSFHVARGETFALVGPNGAGKTTTLKCILGLTHPTSGHVLLGESRLSPTRPETRRSLGYVPQKAEFPPAQSVREVLGYFARLKGLGEDAVDEALARAALESVASRKAAELSGGMTQRLSLAQALLGRPDLLVLDEPTASLDPEATHEFRSLVETLQAEGGTLLLCSHLLSEVERVADRVMVLVEGRAAATVSLHELRAGELRAAADDGTGRGAGCGAGAGVGLAAPSTGARPSLEDLFLDAVRKSRIGVPS